MHRLTFFKLYNKFHHYHAITFIIYYEVIVMSKKEKFFRYGICNIVLSLIVLSVLTLSIGGGVVQVNAPVAIYKGESKNKVSLMINVYWGTEYIDSMLETLNKHNVKTTFFVGGTWAAEQEKTLKKIYAMGHEIGNHGFYHKDCKKIGDARTKEEIEITHKLIKEILGIEMNLFAPPSGSFSEGTLKVAQSLGYKTIMWTADTIDWRDQNKDLIIKRATSKLSGGALILMHPTQKTAEALDEILVAIKQKGLNVSTVSDTLNNSPEV